MKEISQIVAINCLGMAILVDAFKSASSHFVEKSKRHYGNDEVNKESFLFIRGTALEYVLKTYNIAYDADELRKAFFNFIDHKEFIE